jgi:hypothetical protein
MLLSKELEDLLSETKRISQKIKEIITSSLSSIILDSPKVSCLSLSSSLQIAGAILTPFQLREAVIRLA